MTCRGVKAYRNAGDIPLPPMEIMMKYAGFWVRSYAALIDIIVFIPLIAGCMWIQSHSYLGSLLVVIPHFLAYALYCIFFLSRYGQTPGKMVARIRVTRVDGSKIGFREAALRHSVDFAFTLVAGIGMFMAMYRVEPSLFTSDYSWFARNRLVLSHRPRIASIAQDISIYWTWSEMIVLLFNEKRRSVHDFIAGTVVIHVEKSAGQHSDTSVTP